MPRSQRSDHFDGTRFFNPHVSADHGAAEAFRWFLNREPPVWRPVKVEPGPPPPPRVDGDAMRAQWVGHSTVLVQWSGLNLLTDPVWSDRCSPVTFAGPRRAAPPGIPMEALPPIDAVVLSHNHYDHLDDVSVRRLIRDHDPLFVVPVGVGALVRERGGRRVMELDWWASARAQGATFTAVPAQHFSGRGMFDRDRTLWCGFVVEAAAGRFFFAGDTGYSPDFAEIGRRFAPLRLAAIPIGAYEPRWFMAPVHVDPEAAVRIHEDVGAVTSLAIHFGTFPLADDAQDDPPLRLGEALSERGIPAEDFRVLSHGAAMDVPPVAPTDALP